MQALLTGPKGFEKYDSNVSSTMSPELERKIRSAELEDEGVDRTHASGRMLALPWRAMSCGEKSVLTMVMRMAYFPTNPRQPAALLVVKFEVGDTGFFESTHDVISEESWSGARWGTWDDGRRIGYSTCDTGQDEDITTVQVGCNRDTER